MNRARLSILVFGLYVVFAVGLGFMLIPMVILDFFGLSAGDDIWIRFVGMLASILGIYYILVARSQLDRFIPWTVPTRYYAASFMVLMVVLGKLEPSLLLFAAIEAAAATWTWLALRTDVRENAKPAAAGGGA
ncbi:MAG: hypothetical protein WA040_25000 [Anaerolineae bacterium]